MQDGQGEHDRFGIFDPFARLMFVLGVVAAAALAALTVGESLRPANGAGAGAAAGVVLLAIIACGVFGYHAIWRPPREREVLLQMAREEDESKALAAARARDREANAGRQGGARK